jgi:membrane protease YdiL (CAAX protease family)
MTMPAAGFDVETDTSGNQCGASVYLPYLMIHFPKPWLEATGAIFFGLFPGMLALRTRSIWGGVLVHVSIALSMDLLALLQTRGLPVRWWP